MFIFYRILLSFIVYALYYIQNFFSVMSGHFWYYGVRGSNISNMSAHVLLNFIEFYCVCLKFHSTIFQSCWDVFGIIGLEDLT